jgi:hypothetical protein
MNDKEWLDKVTTAATVYNDERLHTDFQEDEILKFLEYLHAQYGYAYTKPKPRYRNTPK